MKHGFVVVILSVLIINSSRNKLFMTSQFVKSENYYYPPLTDRNENELGAMGL